MSVSQLRFRVTDFNNIKYRDTLIDASTMIIYVHAVHGAKISWYNISRSLLLQINIFKK